MLAKGRAQVLHKAEHILLRRLGKILLYIELTNGLAHGALGGAQGAFPARTLLLRSAEHLVELKRSVGKRVGEIARRTRNIFPQIIVLDLTVGERRHQSVGAGHALGVGHDDGVDRSGYVHGLDKETVPGHCGIVLLERLEGAGIVHRLDVAALLAGLGIAGHGRFDLHDGVHDTRSGVGAEAGIGQLAADKLLVGLAHLGVAGIVLKIVVAVVQTHRAAGEIHGVFVGIDHVLHRAGAHEGRSVLLLEPEEQVGHILVGSVLDLVETGAYRSGALGIAAGGVHGLVVDGRHLEGNGARLGIGGGQAGDDILHTRLRRVVEHIELAVA